MGPPTATPLCVRVYADLPRVEMVAGLESPVAQYAEKGSVQLVGAALGNDIDRAPRRAAQFRGKRVAVDLKLVHRFLADRGPYASRVIDVGHAVDGERIPAPAGAADAQPGLRRGGDTEIAVVHDIVGIDDSGGEQRQIQVVAAVDGQVADADGIDVIWIAAFSRARWPASPVPPRRRCFPLPRRRRVAARTTPSRQPALQNFQSAAR